VSIVEPEVEAAAAAIARAVAQRGTLREQAAEHVSQLRDFFAWESAAAMQLERYRTLRRPCEAPAERPISAVRERPARGAPLSSAGR
jgi:hypothetical protein